jgi:MoxR-like ATPase
MWAVELRVIVDLQNAKWNWPRYAAERTIDAAAAHGVDAAASLLLAASNPARFSRLAFARHNRAMAAPTSLVSTRLRSLLSALAHGLLEREAPVRLALLAALAGEHVLLIGPPGTAKSALARRLHSAFANTRYFERLLTRFSTPEELFGPLSLKALEDDRYERLTDGFLPTAGIAFLDEVFKANSAILNALLTLLNEREFDNGTQRVATPLISVVAASNEVPADDALHAFYDRFLLRVPVAPVGDDNFTALLALDAAASRIEAPLLPSERAAIADAAARVALGDRFVAACTGLRQWLASHDHAAMSDRRWRQFVALARTAAASEGRDAVDEYDLWLAPYVASAKPENVPSLQAWFENELLATPPHEAPWLERALQAFEKQLMIEETAPPEDDDDTAGKLALARAIGRTEGLGERDDDAQPNAQPNSHRMVSARLEDKLRRRWSPVHIRCRVEQVSEIEAQVAASRAEVHARAQALSSALATRLWMPPALCAQLTRAHAKALSMQGGMLARLSATRAGFAALPCDEHATAAPAPIAVAEAVE